MGCANRIFVATIWHKSWHWQLHCHSLKKQISRHGYLCSKFCGDIKRIVNWSIFSTPQNSSVRILVTGRKKWELICFVMTLDEWECVVWSFLLYLFCGLKMSLLIVFDFQDSPTLAIETTQINFEKAASIHFFCLWQAPCSALSIVAGKLTINFKINSETIKF